MTAIEEVMAASIWMNPPLMAEIGRSWIDDGTAERVIAVKRRAAEQTDGTSWPDPCRDELQHRPGSLHAWLLLPPPWTGETFARLTRRRGVQVIPSSNFSMQRNGQSRTRGADLHRPAEKRCRSEPRCRNPRRYPGKTTGRARLCSCKPDSSA